MSPHVPESDWRHFKKLHPVLLERFCRQVLDELGTIVRSTRGTAHDRYRRSYELLMERDQEIARVFDDYRRSVVVMQLAIVRRMGLLADEELSVFSEQTQQTVRSVDSLRGAEAAAAPTRKPGRG